ncbi:universal stress protein [Actinomadura fulvescens]|uniref:Universal stress protein n=1 Tax=Actinomadura fulvescens TaxID=46160 RepID=A0ABN3Q456_9ACTN
MDRPVVVGTDGSPSAWAAVEWAAADARARRVPLCIVHAMHVGRYVRGWPAVLPPRDLLRQAGERILTEAVAFVRDSYPGLSVSGALSPSSAPAALGERSQDAFEVVVGHPGHGRLADLMFGSVGLEASGHCPVVIVHGEPRPRCERIVVAVDLATDSSARLAYAFQTAAAYRCRLCALHVVPLSRVLDQPPEREAAPLLDGARDALQRSLAPWSVSFPSVRTQAEMVQGVVTSALIDASLEADLLVIGGPMPAESPAIEIRWSLRDLVSRAHCPLVLVGLGPGAF